MRATILIRLDLQDMLRPLQSAGDRYDVAMQVLTQLLPVQSQIVAFVEAGKDLEVIRNDLARADRNSCRRTEGSCIFLGNATVEGRSPPNNEMLLGFVNGVVARVRKHAVNPTPAFADQAIGQIGVLARDLDWAVDELARAPTPKPKLGTR